MIWEFCIIFEHSVQFCFFFFNIFRFIKLDVNSVSFFYDTIIFFKCYKIFCNRLKSSERGFLEFFSMFTKTRKSCRMLWNILEYSIISMIYLRVLSKNVNFPTLPPPPVSSFLVKMYCSKFYFMNLKLYKTI